LWLRLNRFETARQRLLTDARALSHNGLKNLVARGGMEPPTYRL
jgi:hypothetical protein